MWEKAIARSLPLHTVTRLGRWSLSIRKIGLSGCVNVYREGSYVTIWSESTGKRRSVHITTPHFLALVRAAVASMLEESVNVPLVPL